MPKNFLSASAVLIGYVIGVGMFGLPYLVSKSGLVTFFILLIGLGLVQHFLHLVFANIILVTGEYHRMPGYAGIYLGPWGKRVATASKLIGNYGALLAYIIITGTFINELLSPLFGGNEFVYATLLFALEILVIYFGINTLAKAELGMTLFLLLVIIMIAFKGGSAIDPENFKSIDWRYFFLPYGAMLFAVDGIGAVPVIVRLLRRRIEHIRRVIRVGFYVPLFVIIVFTLTVVGISGADTTPDALSGLRQSFGNGMVLFALVFGVLTMVTSFLGVAEAIREMYTWDYGVNKKLAWALAVFVPYVFYLLGVKNLIGVISFAGAIAGGASAIILILIFLKLRKKKDGLVIFRYRPSKNMVVFLITFFLLGIIFEIYSFMNL